MAVGAVAATLCLANVALGDGSGSGQNQVTTDSPFQVRYAANLANGQESWINVINDGANGAPLFGPGIGGATGNICVNVYAFAPDEEMVSCCSCYLTPSAVVQLGVVRDILSNYIHGGIWPTSLTIKLLATLDGTGGTGGASGCTNSAALVTAPGTVKANGMVAFGTTLHAQTSGVVPFAVTETPFIPATLSTAELNSLGTRCTGIIGNLGGYGMCKSCQPGALGAVKE